MKEWDLRRMNLLIVELNDLLNVGNTKQTLKKINNHYEKGHRTLMFHRISDINQFLHHDGSGNSKIL